MGVAVAPLTLRAASERKMCNLCHRAAVPLVSTGKLPPQSQWGDKVGMVPGWVLHNEPGSEPPAPTLHRTRVNLNAAPLQTPLRWHFCTIWVAETPFFFLKDEWHRGSPHDFIPLKAPASHSSSSMASPQQSRIQSYLERNKIGPLFEVSAPNATLKFWSCQFQGPELCTRLR